MQDKKDDNFFDETKHDEASDQDLMNMIEMHDAPQNVEIKPGQKASGPVVNVGSEYVFIDIGAKNEAMIALAEMKDKEGNVTVKPGDVVEAYIVSVENDEIAMSKSLSARKAGVSDLIDAMKSKVPVQGKVTGINKGGFNVNVMGQRAFCPVSHIDVKYVDDPNVYLTKTLDFIIERVTEGGRNIVLSRLPLLEEDLQKVLDELVESSKEKKVYKGKITKIADFGLFVDVEGVEGLVHISEVSWERAEKLSESFQVGQEVDVVVLKVEKRDRVKNSKVSLSMKHVYDDPWTKVSDTFSVGDSVQGTITRLTNFGAFVQLIPGVEGLIHISEMSWAGRVRHPSDVVSESDTVRVSIIGIDQEKHSISCSLKDKSEDPWITVPEKLPVGATVKGTVASQTRYGFFVDLTDGVTGLLVHQNIASDKKGEVKVGEEVEVNIQSLDLEQRRIGLTMGTVESSAVEQDEEARKYIKKQTKPSGTGGSPKSEFGEMLKQALSKKQ